MEQYGEVIDVSEERTVSIFREGTTSKGKLITCLTIFDFAEGSSTFI
jgi:hypothetical protein